MELYNFISLHVVSHGSYGNSLLRVSRLQSDTGFMSLVSHGSYVTCLTWILCDQSNTCLMSLVWQWSDFSSLSCVWWH